MTNPVNRCIVALYSVDPVALDAFHSFDPESFALIPVINDALIVIGTDGEVEPGLATSWERVSPTEVDFELRRGVSFHNGEPFDADDVVETFRSHREPTPSACGGGILSPIVNCTRIDQYKVRLTTAFPDGMLLRRLFFAQVYPKSVLRNQGRDAFLEKPIGTGAYELVHWKKGDEILLRRNPNHWAQRTSVDEIQIPIVRQKEWIEHLEAGRIDAALNIDAHDTIRAGRIDGLTVRSREAALSQWFLLANRGPLANLDVRRALNHAINRSLLVEVTEHGLGSTQQTVATREQEGYSADVRSYRYSPELARQMLAEAGYEGGFVLRGLVSETSTALFAAVREFLGRVGVTLEAEVVPRTEWIHRVVVSRIIGQPGYDGDFALASVDNPLLHSLFHQFIFLFSQGPFSLTTDEEYDKAFLAAATTTGDEALPAQQRLEAYARDQALMLFTVQQQVHAAMRDGVSITLPRSGHFDAASIWSLTKRPELAPATGIDRADIEPGDTTRLWEATSHLGMFYLGDQSMDADSTARIWQNISTSQERSWLQIEPMMRALVSQVESRANLRNVLESTDRIGIVAYNQEGTLQFSNSGFAAMFGDLGEPVWSLLGRHDDNDWATVRREVDERGSWTGPALLPGEALPDGAATHLYLSVSRLKDDEGYHSGYTLVFSDFSGEEERIRSQAIRVILDNVEFGLFRCDAQGKILPGYSTSCESLFPTTGQLAEARLTDVLGLDRRMAGHFECCYEQIYDDLLPEEVSTGQLPPEVQIGDRFISLSAAVIRDEGGGVDSVLFSAADVTALHEAQREVGEMRGVIKVLKYRNVFESFIQGFVNTLSDLRRGELGVDRDKLARIALHTAKGVFGQFSIEDLAQRIHEIEDEEQIDVSHIEGLERDVTALLDKHKGVWRIAAGASDPVYELAEHELASFEAELADTSDPEQLRTLVRSFTRACRQKSVERLVGPMADSCELHAQKRGKQARLEIVGGELRSPVHLSGVYEVVTHLLRNAIDHGIEPPAARGDKPSRATVRLTATRTEDRFVLSLADDGRGIDIDAVTAKAISSGVLTAESASALDHQGKLALVFESGLSTAETVTDTSGRGVGLSAVRDVVDGLGGEIRIDTAPGRGTTFTLDLPRRPLAVAARTARAS